ncbi:hypothetical protein BH10BAC5_BH10BAC5_25820 [soil metagenome]
MKTEQEQEIIYFLNDHGISMYIGGKNENVVLAYDGDDVVVERNKLPNDLNDIDSFMFYEFYNKS